MMAVIDPHISAQYFWGMFVTIKVTLPDDEHSILVLEGNGMSDSAKNSDRDRPYSESILQLIPD